MLFKKASLLDKIIALLSESFDGFEYKNVLEKLKQDKRIKFDEALSTLTINLPFYAPLWLTGLQEKIVIKLRNS